MSHLHSVILLAVALACSACGGDPVSNATPHAGSGGPQARAGASTDVFLQSDVDGATIAFTVHEPDSFVEGVKYPLLMEGHGYTGFRIRAQDRGALADFYPLFANLLAAGYGIVSVDQRGHGDSGGMARVLDPDHEGQDLLQVLDWAEANVPWLSYRNGNLVLGSFGESYGAAFQLLIHRLDPKHRLDAMVPDITWHDLRYSFFGGQAFKSAFALGFNAAAIQNSTRQDPYVTQLLLGGTLANSLSADQLDFFYRASPVSACEAGALTPVDVLFTQSASDALFNFNEGYANYECYRALGGDVRLWVKPYGHGISVDGLSPVPLPVVTPLGAGSNSRAQNCGQRDRAQAAQAWFDEKLKGIAGAASAIPRICAHLGQDGEDAVVLDSIATGGGAPIEFGPQTLLLLDGTMSETAVPLHTLEQDGEVFGGIPTVSITLLDPLLGQAGLGDPILFVGIGLQRDGTVAPLNQLSPVRGYGARQVKLPGAFERLRAGDVLVLRLRSGSVFNYAGTGSRLPTLVSINASVSLPLLGPLPSSPR